MATRWKYFDDFLHFDDFQEKNALQHEVQDKTNKYKLAQKGNKISDRMV